MSKKRQGHFLGKCVVCGHHVMTRWSRTRERFMKNHHSNHDAVGEVGSLCQVPKCMASVGDVSGVVRHFYNHEPWVKDNPSA